MTSLSYLALNLPTELAKEGIPLPFGSRFWASNWPTGKSPLPGLIIHLIPSVRPRRPLVCTSSTHKVICR